MAEETVVNVEEKAIVATGSVALLSTQQQLAMEWLMGGGSITDAAQYANVTRQTVSRWVHTDADFREFYERWQQQVRSANQSRLLELTDAAIDTLGVAICEQKDVRAAIVLLKGTGTLGKLP